MLNMLRRAMVFVMLLAPATAMAQQGSAVPIPEGRLLIGASVFSSPMVRLDQSQPTPQQPPARRPRGTRRPSMVGYIDDATPQSRVRVRFDLGTGNESPDLAEFFYAKCGCFRQGPAGHENLDKDAPGPFEAGPVTSLDFQEWHALGEVALGSRFSLFADVPFRSIAPKTFFPANSTFPDTSLGLGDLRFGVKYALVSKDRGIVTFQARGSVPTGDALLGRGTDHATIEPALLFWGQVSDRFAIEGMVGDSHPLSGSAGLPTSGAEKFSGDVVFWGIGPSYQAYRSGDSSVAAVVELVGWRVLGGFKSVGPNVSGARYLRPPCCGAIAADGTNIVNIKFGVRATIDGRNSFYVGFGRALTDDVWYRDIVRIEYRVSR